MQPIQIPVPDVSAWVVRLWWPVLRIGGFIAAAPIVSHSSVPAMVKIALTLALAFILAPLVPVPVGLSIFSGAGVVAALEEVLIGVAIALIVQLAFEALDFAGQSISTSMGLGFATLVDPQHAAGTPVLGQLFTMFGLLAYLAVNGHLVLLGALAGSFQSLPIGGGALERDMLMNIASWGGRIFEAGLLVALPAVISLVIVNLALGVVSRAAPQLNLFGIGFTITLLSGFFVLIVGIDGLMMGVSSLIESALRAARDFTAPAGVH
jgi:flagellar biosynthetic protein FliR